MMRIPGLGEGLLFLAVIAIFIIKGKVLAPKAADSAAEGVKAYKKGFKSFMKKVKEDPEQNEEK